MFVLVPAFHRRHRAARSPFLVALALLALLCPTAACTLGPPTPAYRTLGVSKPQASLIGKVVVDVATGRLVLQLGPEACMRREDRLYRSGDIGHVVKPCSAHEWNAEVTSPWGQVFPADQALPGLLSFKVDWSATGLDPLATTEPELLRKPWRFRALGAHDVLWTPDDPARAGMLRLVGDATDTQTWVADVAAPPRLEVSAVSFTSDLRNGSGNDIVVSITNQGKGDAYRVSTVTRSNVPALHDIHLSFGRLRPGETKTRRAHFELPRANDEPEALIVLDVDEAHRYTPPQSSMRYPLKKAVDLAVLSLDCHFADLSGDKPRVDAGMTVHVTCNVHNDGSPARAVAVHAGFEGGQGGSDARPFDLASDRTMRVDVALDVPRDASIDAPLTVRIEAADSSGVRAQATLHLEVGRPQLCPGGRITRERFLEKRADLRRKLDAGLISKEDYERYEAELVGCMK
jgi:hypothetical protein